MPSKTLELIVNEVSSEKPDAQMKDFVKAARAAGHRMKVSGRIHNIRKKLGENGGGNSNGNGAVLRAKKSTNQNQSISQFVECLTEVDRLLRQHGVETLHEAVKAAIALRSV